jgi:hypothetical protein
VTSRPPIQKPEVPYLARIPNFCISKAKVTPSPQHAARPSARPQPSALHCTARTCTLCVCCSPRCAGCRPHGHPGLITATRLSSPPQPHKAAALVGPARRPRRRSPLQRFPLQICCRLIASPTPTICPLHQPAPTTVRPRQVPRNPPAPGGAQQHIPALEPQLQHAEQTPSRFSALQPSPASACTRLQITGSATVSLCSPASSQATLAPLLLQFSLRAILVCVSTYPRRHPHTACLASLCPPFIHIPDPHPLPPTFYA